MNKTLLTCLLAAGFCGTTDAQSNVTIYGVMDYGLITQDVDGSNRRTALDSGVSSGSRLGFKGTENLGNGFKVGFQLEAGIEGDTGFSGQGGRLFGRAAWTSLAGSFGEVRFGRQNTFGYGWLTEVSPFGTTYGQAAFATIFGYKDVGDRIDNALFYYTPDFDGFQAGIGYSRHGDGQESAGNEEDNAIVSAGARYDNGPLTVVFAYDRKNDSDVNDDPGRDDIVNMGLGAVYDFNAVKLHAAVGQLKNRHFDAHADTEKSWLIGVSAPVGENGSLFGTYQRVSDGRNKNENNIKSNRKGLAIGYTHNLSKRTNLYAFASQYSDVGKRQDNELKLADSAEFGFGVRHRF